MPSCLWLGLAGAVAITVAVGSVTARALERPGALRSVRQVREGSCGIRTGGNTSTAPAGLPHHDDLDLTCTDDGPAGERSAERVMALCLQTLTVPNRHGRKVAEPVP